MKRASGLVCILGLSIMGCASSAPEQKQAPTVPMEAPPVESLPAPTVSAEQNDQIDAVFRRKAPQLQDCWTAHYNKTHDRKVEGDLTLGMNIQPSGAPSEVRILKTSLGNAEIEACVVKEISSWNFAEGTSPVPYMRSIHLGPQF